MKSAKIILSLISLFLVSLLLLACTTQVPQLAPPQEQPVQPAQQSVQPVVADQAAQSSVDAQPTPSDELPPGRSTLVEIKDTAFNPSSVTVKTGGIITWRNLDSVPHTISADDDSFGSGTLAPGDAFSTSFPNAGRFTYTCGIHPSMEGIVVVEE